MALASAQLQRQVGAILAKKADGNRDVIRLLVRLTGRRRTALLQSDREELLDGLMMDGRFDRRRSSLVVPVLELGEIGLVGVGHRRHEVVSGHGLAVMALEIEIHAFTETG